MTFRRNRVEDEPKCSLEVFEDEPVASAPFLPMKRTTSYQNSDKENSNPTFTLSPSFSPHARRIRVDTTAPPSEPCSTNKVSAKDAKSPLPTTTGVSTPGRTPLGDITRRVVGKAGAPRSRKRERDQKGKRKENSASAPSARMMR
ncbi:hypothetical protein CYMTET_6619 [Cymbomonas tetramitiformis]|uniref:Uncharacterized protein n=1 Tax=Cymbomonas tetramitiformis TaxID=36881 RepID=A0AAE0GWR6_9CHLO|nr:hypothetical protein CYMTET_6619 [Cymbomonas tetramitiformis]